MFVWLKVKNHDDTAKLVKEKALTEKVILVPGESFLVNDSIKSNYVRAAFSSAELNDIDEAIRRFAKLCKSDRQSTIVQILQARRNCANLIGQAQLCKSYRQGTLVQII